MWQKYKIYGLVYGFLVSFFFTFLVFTFGESPETVPLKEILVKSFYTGVVFGVICWFYFAIIKGSGTEVRPSIGDDSASDYSSGGDSGGGD